MGEHLGQFGATNVLGPYRVELILSDLTNNCALHHVSSDPLRSQQQGSFPCGSSVLGLEKWNFKFLDFDEDFSETAENTERKDC